MKITNIVSLFKNGLLKSRENILQRIEYLINNSKNKQIFLESLEELLILSDVGVAATEEIIIHFNKISFKEYEKNDFLYFKEQLKEILIDVIT